MKHYTISYPGEYNQHVQETWSEEQILKSAWYRNWVMKVIEADRAYLIENKQNAIDDWIVVHWAVETGEWGDKLLVLEERMRYTQERVSQLEKEFSNDRTLPQNVKSI